MKTTQRCGGVELGRSSVWIPREVSALDSHTGCWAGGAPRTWHRNHCLALAALLFPRSASQQRLCLKFCLLLLHFRWYVIKTQRTACKRQYSFPLRKKGEQVNPLLSNFKCFCWNLPSVILTSWHSGRSTSVCFVLMHYAGKLDPEVSGVSFSQRLSSQDTQSVNESNWWEHWRSEYLGNSLLPRVGKHQGLLPLASHLYLLLFLFHIIFMKFKLQTGLMLLRIFRNLGSTM